MDQASKTRLNALQPEPLLNLKLRIFLVEPINLYFTMAGYLFLNSGGEAEGESSLRTQKER